MIGEYTEYNTLVTEVLIEKTEKRIEELKQKEIKWQNTIAKLIQ